MSYYSAFSNLNKDITTLGKAIEDFNFDAVGYGARSDLWRTLSKTITTYIHDTDNGKLNAENRDMILQIIKTVGDRTDDHSARLLVHFMGKIETLPKVISGYSRLLYDILGRGYGISSNIVEHLRSATLTDLDSLSCGFMECSIDNMVVDVKRTSSRIATTLNKRFNQTLKKHRPDVVHLR
jgi:hypothetical protein